MIIFTDGACTANGKANAKGGFGVLVLDDDGNFVDCHQEFCEGTTNNREEIKAILWAYLKYGASKIWTSPIVYSDSAYCVNTFTIWMDAWERNGWVKSDNTTPLNLDLIKIYYEYRRRGYYIDLQKVKGHAGIKENEIVDGLATGRLSIKKVREMYGK